MTASSKTIVLFNVLILLQLGRRGVTLVIVVVGVVIFVWLSYLTWAALASLCSMEQNFMSVS
eukprot:5891421-Amphidinium_carterae.1